MIEIVLDSVVLPVASGTAILLAPRLPWSVDAGRRVDAWTGPLACALVVLLSLIMVEGRTVLYLGQKWEWIAASALIIGIGGTTRTAASLSHRSRHRAILLTAVALSLVILRFPGYETLPARLVATLVAVVAAFLLTTCASREPVRMPLALALSCGSLTLLLFSAGSLKVASVAASLASICALAALLAYLGRGFSAGASFCVASMTLSGTMALYGCAYHAQEAVSTQIYLLVWATPLLLAFAPAFRSPRVATVVVVIIAVICACAVGGSVNFTDALEEVEETSASYTSITERGMDGTRALSWHHAVTV